jgi:hypothetical protein
MRSSPARWSPSCAGSEINRGPRPSSSACRATALELERPVVVLTSDPDDLSKLVEEPGRPKAQRIAVIHV